MEAVGYGLEKQDPKGQKIQLRAEGPHIKRDRGVPPQVAERQPPATQKTKQKNLNQEA